MVELQARSPLPEHAQAPASREFQLRELKAVTKMRVQALRSRGSSTRVADPLKLPSTPNTTAGDDPIAFWRAPDDWLVCSRTLDAAALSNWVKSVASDIPLVVTDVSSASVLFELKGSQAVEVLMRDCPLDLEGNSIPPGGCAQTLFAQTCVLFHRPMDPGSWHLFVERSVAFHVWEWLLDSAAPAR